MINWERHGVYSFAELDRLQELEDKLRSGRLAFTYQTARYTIIDGVKMTSSSRSPIFLHIDERRECDGAKIFGVSGFLVGSIVDYSPLTINSDLLPEADLAIQRRADNSIANIAPPTAPIYYHPKF